MRRHIRSWGMLALTGLTAFCVGCGGSDKSGGGPQSKGSGQNVSTEGAGGQAVPEKPQPKPAPPTVPKVVLDAALAATCRVKQNDFMPEGQLPDLDGKPHALKEVFGKRLTVVVFWDKGSLQALQELGDLATDILQPYGQRGVAVIAVNVGDTPEGARQGLEIAGASVPVLLDPDRSYFRRVATERIPRTYVLDAGGKVLWFDTEYSEATSRGMIQTIEATLLENGSP